MDTLVNADWLYEHLNDPDLVIIDCTVITEVGEDGSYINHSGRKQYHEAHIPGAAFADLTVELSDTSSDIEFALPEPAEFCRQMGLLGVGDKSRVVLYDAVMTAWAARVWWMLRWVGFDNAAILDGGLNAWTAAGHLVSAATPVYKTQSLTPNLRPGLIADRAEVYDAIDHHDVRLIDTLPEDHYRGGATTYARSGHIPSAINISAMNLMDETGCYRPDEELEKMHPGDRKQRNITYCGGGILASSSAFVMTRLGFDNVAVYTASLQEWAANAANPMSAEPG